MLLVGFGVDRLLDFGVFTSRILSCWHFEGQICHLGILRHIDCVCGCGCECARLRCISCRHVVNIQILLIRLNTSTAITTTAYDDSLTPKTGPIFESHLRLLILLLCLPNHIHSLAQQLLILLLNVVGLRLLRGSIRIDIICIGID